MSEPTHSAEAYPLSWPIGWPRVRTPGKSRFWNGWTLYRARSELENELRLMRGQLRWGVGTLEQAFGGYRALPAMPAAKQWWEILGVEYTAAWDEIETARLALLKKNHPDLGGETTSAAEINSAFDEAKKERGPHV